MWDTASGNASKNVCWLGDDRIYAPWDQELLHVVGWPVQGGEFQQIPKLTPT